MATSHKDDTLWGAVAEALVSAYALIGAAGKLTAYRPFSDVDGKDIIIDLAGGFKDIYLQVKCALGVNRNRCIGGTVRMRHGYIPSDPKLVYVFCLLNKQKMELTRLWVVPAAAFYKRAYRTALPKGMIQFNFDCRLAGDKRWDEFEVTRAELGPRLVKLIRAAAKRERRARMNKLEQLDGRWLQFVA
ncbi:MAG: hypothetical protein E6I37_09145 [Chloroflexi bacterium]|nr:MAG: hypothetical protein E6I37_09145 [Chloroflexota bacterium]